MNEAPTRRDIRIVRMAAVRRELEQHPAMLAPTRKPPKKKRQCGMRHTVHSNGHERHMAKVADVERKLA